MMNNRRLQTAFAILIVFAFVYMVADLIVLPLYTRRGSEKPVPKLIGLSATEAKTAAELAGFRVQEDAPKMGGNLPEGTILEQHPFAGALAKPGRKIRVIPSGAAVKDQVPDLIGLDLRDAQIRCRNVGMVCGDSDVRYRFSERVHKGAVISQDPKPGTLAEPGGVIKLTVSMGPQPAQLFMPTLIEKSLAEARTILRESGLKLGKIVRKETDLYPSGTVIAQSIRTGEEVSPGATVNIVVAVPKGQE